MTKLVIPLVHGTDGSELFEQLREAVDKLNDAQAALANACEACGKEVTGLTHVLTALTDYLTEGD